METGPDTEMRQGKNVADVAREVGVRHLVYSSAATEVAGTGVPPWESKLAVEAHARDLGLPMTVLRPMAFMELMTDKGFFPAVSTWQLMPKLMGGSRPLPWIAIDDLGVVVAKVFAEPDRFVGQVLRLAADVCTLDECRALYREAFGRSPSRFPMPVWAFERFVGPDLLLMWRWLHSGEVDLDTAQTKAIHPAARGVREWLGSQT
jgi:uncharacterized protein YbjT (DUF2867 family)